MPADRKSSRSKPAADAEPQPEPEAESEAPLNRAERRGRKKGAGSQPAGHGKVAGRSGPVQGPRMWTNRRGGG